MAATQTNKPQGNPGYLTDMDVRLFLRDKDPELNYLLDDYEFTPEELRTAMTLAVDKWNESPPVLTTHMYTTLNFPFRYNLLLGTCANLMYMAAMRYRRNSLTYNIPGGQVADQEKYQQYDAAGQRLSQEYTEWVAKMKRAINIECGFGIIDGGMHRYPR